MQQANFTFDYSIGFLTSFNPPKKWWHLKKTIKLDLPILNEAAISSIASIQNLNNSNLLFEVTSLKKDFLASKEGRQYIDSYITQLKNLSLENQDYIKNITNEFIRYSLDIIVKNPISHDKSVTLDAFELYGITQLLHTARALKNAQISGKKLVLIDDSVENLTEEYVYFGEYWHIENDQVEMRYTDWDADDDAEAEKVHTAQFNSITFVQQFNTVAHDIADLISKICRALNITMQDLEKKNAE